MEQRRSRLVAPDTTGLRARVLSTGGLLVVAAMVLMVLVTLYPRQQLIDRLSAQPQIDELSVNYLANLLDSEPDNVELRVLLAEHRFKLGQWELSQSTLQPLLGKTLPNESLAHRVSVLNYRVLEKRVSAAKPDDEDAAALKAQLIESLEARVSLGPWTNPELLDFARGAALAGRPQLVQRFLALIRLDEHSDREPWFSNAVRTAISVQDYVGAADLHLRALSKTASNEARRSHLREALRILQSGNLLDRALAVGREHEALVADDTSLLNYLTRLSLAANRPTEAQHYAKRLLRMSRADDRPGAAPGVSWPVRWLARSIDLVVSPAQAAEPVAARPAASAVAVENGDQDPKLPFQEEAYLLAYETFLGSRNQMDAWRVASSAVRQQPNSLAWRERFAQVSEWVGKPAVALEQWRTLAAMASRTGGEAKVLDRALKAVLRLAPSLNDDEALLAMWTEVASLRRLTVDETLGLVVLSERLGRPEEGLRWLQKGISQQPDRRLLEMQVDLLERMGDLPAAMAASRTLMQREGVTVQRAMRLARMHGVRGEHAEALKVLLPLAPRVPESDLEYWRFLGSLAWTLQDENTAHQALSVTTRQPELDPTEADRMMQLLRTRDPRRAALFAERAWGQLREPMYVLNALDLWGAQRDFNEFERLLGRLDADTEKKLATNTRYWMLRAQWHEARGDLQGSLADMRRALEIAPADVDIRVSYLFGLIDVRAVGELQLRLSTWYADAVAHPAYDAAFGAGYVTLDQPSEALPFWRRQAPSRRNDPMWMAAYADVLEAMGWTHSAQGLRRQAQLTIRRGLSDPALLKGMPADQVQSLEFQLARLRLAEAKRGDGQQRVVSGIAAPKGLLSRSALKASDRAAAHEMVLAWLLSTEQQDRARMWLWRRYDQTISRPEWVEMALALEDGKRERIAELLEGADASRISQGQRIEALHSLGRVVQAQKLRVAELQRRDEDAQHETYTDVAWQRARRVEYGFDVIRDAVHAQRQSLAVRLPVSDSMRVKLSAEQSNQRAGTPPRASSPILGQIASMDRAVAASLRYEPRPELQVEGTLGHRSAERSFATGALSIRVQPTSRLQVWTELSVNDRPTDSAPLAVAGRQQETRFGADVRLSLTNPLSVAVRTARLDLQSCERLGSVRGLEWSLAHILRGATPELSVRAFGNYAQFQRSTAVLPSWTSRLTTDGSLPDASFFVPDSYSLHGVGVNAGLQARDNYSRAWRPFLDLSLTRHNRLGAGYGAAVGVAGRLLSSDQLLIQFAATRSGASSDARVLGLRYILPF